MNSSIRRGKDASRFRASWGVSVIVLFVGLAFSFQMLPAQTTTGNNSGLQLQKDAVTTYIVRDKIESGINLTMLIAHNTSLTSQIKKMLNRDVLPFTFSVSTLPNQSHVFDPALLQFEQRGQVWQLDSTALQSWIVPLDSNGVFGGTIKGGQLQQAVVLLPGWFDIDTPIYVRYIESSEKLELAKLVQ